MSRQRLDPYLEQCHPSRRYAYDRYYFNHLLYVSPDRQRSRGAIVQTLRTERRRQANEFLCPCHTHHHTFRRICTRNEDDAFGRFQHHDYVPLMSNSTHSESSSQRRDLKRLRGCVRWRTCKKEQRSRLQEMSVSIKAGTYRRQARVTTY